MSDSDQNKPPEDNLTKEGQGFEILGQYDRVESRMLTDGQTWTPEIDRQLAGEMQDWRKDHPSPKDPGKPHRPRGGFLTRAAVFRGADHPPTGIFCPRPIGTGPNTGQAGVPRKTRACNYLSLRQLQAR